MNLFKVTKYIILFLLLSNISYAAVEKGVIKIDHCLDCDTLLIGAANVYPNSIQWVGSQLGSITLRSKLYEYGFTGWQKNYDLITDNLWNMDGPQKLSVISAKADGIAPSIGFFFVPSSEEKYTTDIVYTVSTIGDISKKITGVGVLDDKKAITLKVEASYPNGSVQGCGIGCQEISIPVRGKVTFTVTPDIDQNIVQELGLNPDSHNNVFIRLAANEKDTGCSTVHLAFEDRGQKVTQGLSTDKNNYYDFLGIAGPDAMLRNCSRGYSFLRSSGKSFEFYANNVYDTGTGYAEYKFAVEGHYDIQKWPNSIQTFRIRTTDQIVTNQSPTARISATPSTGQAPLEVSLNALSSSDSDGRIASYEWTSDGIFMSSEATPPVHTFSQVGTYSIGLTVTDNQGATHSTQKTITVLANNETLNKIPTALFTTKQNGFKIDLDAANSVDEDGTIAKYTWSSSDGQQIVAGQTASITFRNVGNYKITLTVKDDDGSSSSPVTKEFDIVAQSEPPIARFEVIHDIFIDNNELQQPIVLNPATSEGSIEKWEWSILNICSNAAEADLPETGEEFSVTLKNGKYLISLTVIDNNGQKDVTSKPITIPHLLADFTTNFVGLRTIELDATKSTIPHTDVIDCETPQVNVDKITDYWWWASYNTEKIAEDAIDTSKFEYVFEREPKDGDYVISLLVIDDNGQMASKSKVIEVLDEQLLTLSDNGKLLEDETYIAAKFKSGVFIGNELITDGKFDYINSEVTVVATIIVNKDHINTKVEPLVIIRASGENSPAHTYSWYLKTVDNAEGFKPWYGEGCICNVSTDTTCAKIDIAPDTFNACNWLPLTNSEIKNTIQAASNAEKILIDNTTVDTLKIDIFNGRISDAIFNKKAHPANLFFSEIDIFIGYRVTDENSKHNGTIVYSETPITLKNKPN